MNVLRTDSEHKDFIDLVALLDTDLAERDGEDHAFYDQYNKIDALKHTIVLYKDKVPVGCGAIKKFDAESMEVKRMYTLPIHRGKGYGTQVLTELEVWAKELGYVKCVLETGKRQPEAIELYTKRGYLQRPNYGQYIGIENSVCFEKNL
ncbi:MAG: GNAT family N-acetyltransferase [Flavobacteriaceae bacterium]|nr:GNAT family N-acetyltransferase [Flavobacteriaceae bacterium]